MLMEGVHNILAVSKLPNGFWAEVLSTYVYSRTSIIQTPLCYLYHKSVQINEFVRISEAHSLIYKVVIKYSNRTHYSNRTYTWSQNILIKQSVILFG